MTPADWIEHRRPEGERVGWLVPSGEGFDVVDLLGRQRNAVAMDWDEAEETLEDLGIGYLAHRYSLRLDDDAERRVRVGEASPARIVVVADDYGTAAVIGADPDTYELPFPAPDTLRSLDE